MEFLKQGLKKLDEDYPIEGDKPLSSAKLTSKQLTDHIEFIIAYMGKYGLTPVVVEEEWKRILKDARN